MIAEVLDSNHDLDSAVHHRWTGRPARTSFEDLYSKYYPTVFNLCFRMLHNSADAEDLTQETFLQIMRKIENFRGESSLSTWIHRVTVNQVLMYFRKKWTYKETTTESGNLPDTVKSMTLRHIPLPITDQIAIATAAEQLPAGYRNVFLLHDVEGYEHEEVARILGISPGTSKSQLHKARLRLRSILKEPPGTDSSLIEEKTELKNG
jgi:RNA polymerase sigma-70 factor, ECF subfamily